MTVSKSSVYAVVLDAMGVIYEARDDVAKLLIPFARMKGCMLPDAQIYTAYITASLGKLSSAELWSELGIKTPAPQLDPEYLSGHTMTHGVREFLEFACLNNLEVYCLSNDVSEWSAYLRRNFGLEEYVKRWIISGDVGARKPDSRIFQILLEETGLQPERTLFVDDSLPNVITAGNVGFQTLWFAPNGELGGEQPYATSFAEIEEWILSGMATL